MNRGFPLVILESVNLTLFILCVVTAAINIPFGIVRAGQERYSWQWLLAVHLSVPLIIILRLATHQGWGSIPWLVACAVAGQLTGSLLKEGQRRATAEEE